MKLLNLLLVPLLLVAMSPTADAATLRLASLVPKDSAWGKLIQSMANEIKATTDGDVKFKLYLDGKQGDESKVSKKLGRGLHGAFFTGQGMGLLLPAFRVQELPFLSENYGEADKVRTALWPSFEKAFEDRTKFVLLGAGETGMVHVFSKQSISSVADLKASSLWVWEGDSVASNTFKVFGVSPRPLDILSVVQQLKSGAVNAVYSSPAGAVALGWTGDLTHVTGRNFAYASGGFVLTKKAWAKIKPEHQVIVKGIVNKFGEQIIGQVRKDNTAAMTRLTAAGGGLQKVDIPDAKYNELKGVGVKAWPKLASELEAGPLLEIARKAVGK